MLAVMALPPVLDGVDHRTTADLVAAVTETLRGALAVVNGTTAPERAEAGPVPTAFVATTSMK